METPRPAGGAFVRRRFSGNHEVVWSPWADTRDGGGMRRPRRRRAGQRGGAGGQLMGEGYGGGKRRRREECVKYVRPGRAMEVSPL